jgi:uncharacterized membrane protein YdcZ (DUF606 family)
LAIVMDHFRSLGVEPSPITVAKMAGVVLLGVAAWLVIGEQGLTKYFRYR